MFLIIPTKNISHNLTVTGKRLDNLLAPYDINLLGDLKNWNGGVKYAEFP